MLVVDGVSANRNGHQKSKGDNPERPLCPYTFVHLDRPRTEKSRPTRKTGSAGNTPSPAAFLCNIAANVPVLSNDALKLLEFRIVETGPRTITGHDVFEGSMPNSRRNDPQPRLLRRGLRPLGDYNFLSFGNRFGVGTRNINVCKGVRHFTSFLSALYHDIRQPIVTLSTRNSAQRGMDIGNRAAEYLMQESSK